MDTVILIFGDSISYGIYDNELGWAYRLRKKLDNNHFIFNQSIPGQGSFDILNKFEIELKNRYNEIDGFKVIFSFGIKDTLKNNINDFKNNVLEIINKTKTYTKDITFIGLIKPDINERPEYDLDKVILFDNELEKICNKENLKYIKLIDLINNNELVDGLHPNDVGHEKILKEIYEIYKVWSSKRKRCLCT